MSYHLNLQLCECMRATVYSHGACYACYKKRWLKTTTAPLVHGKNYTYAQRGCRCEPCRDANRTYRKKKGLR
ncbi:hypothetical protein [Herbiconiux sp. VKM Ac-2851]|uniref:hypothetical protein n=1 Tax=Herbiconiux sp. VKM Ac-2851 TaxID=2739025 RepID=UPI001566DD97|nr:hypothetical protein [Herbiconiux sp. VKM Ac-2851]NQX34045.1 hypothetical protein [Herbiconiux sp. VKM Ac-2851]